ARPRAVAACGSGPYTASGGLHGVGASVVNALSARLDVESDRQGHTHAISFCRGMAGRFEDSGPDAKFTEGSGLEQIRKIAKKKTGTRIRFWPDMQRSEERRVGKEGKTR